MTIKLPQFINPIRMADNGVQLAGTILLSDMERLVTILPNASGEAAVQIRFAVDAQGLHFLQGHITATLQLECQRCLQWFAYKIDEEFFLSPVYNDEQAAALPGCYESLLVVKDEVALSSMLEEEILLNLPIVAMHSEAECPINLTVEKPLAHNKQENPFKKLAVLKERK